MNLTKQNILKTKAEEQTIAYAEAYAKEIQNSIDGTVIYRDCSSFREMIKPLQKAEKTFTEQIVSDINVISLLHSLDPYKEQKIAVLDFAEYKNPSRAFIEGRESQEASLCHNSVLYNILSAFEKNYYQINRRKLNKSLYTDTALYIPDVKFVTKNDNIPSINIIACSAPNRRAAQNKIRGRYYNVCKKVYLRRLKFIKYICELNNIEVLVAGAWGTGCDMYSAFEVARLWVEEFSTSSTIKTVFYAVPPTKHNHYCHKDSPFESEIRTQELKQEKKS